MQVLEAEPQGLMAAAGLPAQATPGPANWRPVRSVPRLGSAWYINLDDFVGRRDEMERAYRSSGMRYTRFPATRPTQASLLPHGEWHALWAHFHHSRQHEIYDPVLSARIRGEVGCIASHLQLLQHLKATGRPGEVYLMAEDDYVPVPDFQSRLPTVLASLPSDWDSVRFDCWESPGESIHRMPEARPGLFWSAMTGCSAQDGQPEGRPECHFCGGTHAVLVPYEKVDKFIALWSGEQGPLFPLDCMMTRPDFRNFCLQWGFFRKVEHLNGRTAIPKRAENVTGWHVE